MSRGDQGGQALLSKYASQPLPRFDCRDLPLAALHCPATDSAFGDSEPIRPIEKQGLPVQVSNAIGRESCVTNKQLSK
jgi:hypothetical protein